MKGYVIFGVFAFLVFGIVSAGWEEDKPKMLANFVDLNRKFRTLKRVQDTQQQTIVENKNELVRKQKIIDDLTEKDSVKQEEIRALEKIQNAQQQTINENANELVKKQEVIDTLMKKDKVTSDEVQLLKIQGMDV